MFNIFEEIQDLVFGNKRMSTLKHFARTKDFRFSRRADVSKLPKELLEMSIFQQRRSASIKGLLSRTDSKLNALAQIFDYSYMGDFGKYTTTIFLFYSEKLRLPYFSVNPKSGLGKLGSIFSNNEWSLVSKEFGKSFDVQSTDMNKMNMTITLQFAEIMLKNRFLTVEGKGNYLIAYQKNRTVDIVDMDNVYDDGLELLDVILH